MYLDGQQAASVETSAGFSARVKVSITASEGSEEDQKLPKGIRENFMQLCKEKSMTVVRTWKR